MRTDRRFLLCCLGAGILSPSASLAGLLNRPGESRTFGKGTFDPRSIYAEVSDHDFAVPAVHYAKLGSRFLRQRVRDASGAPPGSILVDVAEHFLYVVNGDGSAIRYGVGVGRAGYTWRGQGEVARISSWPRWTPTADMRSRTPELKMYKSGVPGGLENPLGARALYIFQNGRDTLYRVHGTPEWWSIGKSVSSGCIRMLHQDVIDLSLRSRPGAAIIVL